MCNANLLDTLLDDVSRISIDIFKDEDPFVHFKFSGVRVLAAITRGE